MIEISKRCRNVTGNKDGMDIDKNHEITQNKIFKYFIRTEAKFRVLRTINNKKYWRKTEIQKGN